MERPSSNGPIACNKLEAELKRDANKRDSLVTIDLNDAEASKSTEHQDAVKGESTKAPKTRVGFGKIISLSRPEWPALTFCLVLIAVGEVAGMYQPLVMARAYDAAVDPTLHRDEKRQRVQNAMVICLLLHFGAQFLGFVRGLIIGMAGERVVARLRNRLYSHFLSCEIGFFDCNKTGELVSRLSADTETIQGAATNALPDAATSFARCCAGLALMGVISAKMMGITIAAALVTFFVIAPLAAAIASVSKRYQDALARSSSRSTETLGSMRTVRSFVAEAVEAKSFTSIIGDPGETFCCWWPKRPSQKEEETVFRLGVIRSAYYSGAISTFFALFLGANLFISWVGFLLIIDGEITLGDLTAFNAYIFMIGFGLGQFVGEVVKLVQASGASARIFELLERPPKIPLDGGVSPSTIIGDIAFSDVHFSYPTRPDALVLEGFSLHVPAHSTCALVGASGSGKSTVIALLQRFYETTQGTISVDGQDIRLLNPGWLRRHIGFVQQEPVLFGRTIRDNLTYGLLGKDFSDEHIDQVMKKANAYEFVTEFPDGYATLVGERGVKLSGGQKQRLAIARALLVDPAILLLDEATSALDAESEHLVQEAIQKLMAGRTTILVAHRLSTVRNADQIVVVDTRRIIDVGTHNKLMDRCERYQALVKQQLMLQSK